MASWEESLHPRNRGKFATKAGAGAWARRRLSVVRSETDTSAEPSKFPTMQASFKKFAEKKLGSGTTEKIEHVAAENPWGFSFRPNAAPQTHDAEGKVTSGYMVALHHDQGFSHVIDPAALKSKKEFREAIRAWVKTAAPKIASNPELHFGGWIDSNTGKLYLDISERVDTKHGEEHAKRLGRERDQLAIWHVDKSEEIRTGGTGGQSSAA